MSTRLSLVAGSLALLLVATGCGDPDPEIANPASEYCVEQGGEVDIVMEDDGEVGYCVLPDGTRIEEWEFFREGQSDGS